MKCERCKENKVIENGTVCQKCFDYFINPLRNARTTREEATKEIKKLLKRDLDFKKLVPVATVICKKKKPLILFHKTKATKRR